MVNLSRDIPQITEALRRTYAFIGQLQDAEKRMAQEVERFKEARSVDSLGDFEPK
jgi:hypothetical protein